MRGSSLLGIALLRRGFRPRTSAWLLALTFPLVFVIELFTSMGYRPALAEKEALIAQTTALAS